MWCNAGRGEFYQCTYTRIQEAENLFERLSDEGSCGNPKNSSCFSINKALSAILAVKGKDISGYWNRELRELGIRSMGSKQVGSYGPNTVLPRKVKILKSIQYLFHFCRASSKLTNKRYFLNVSQNS